MKHKYRHKNFAYLSMSSCYSYIIDLNFDELYIFRNDMIQNVKTTAG